jgi:hypothetical protein
MKTLRNLKTAKVQEVEEKEEDQNFLNDTEYTVIVGLIGSALVNIEEFLT